MSSSRLNTYQLAESRRPRMRSENRRAKKGNSDSLEFAEQIRQEAEGELRALPNLTTDISLDEDQFDQSYLVELCEEDTMSYPYPNYNDEVDTDAHVRVFLMTWQANHVSQRLSEASADKSKILEFGLLLDGQSTNWYS